MPRITTASAKCKGRRLQQMVRDKLRELCPQLEPADIESTPMGSAGADIILSPAAKRLLPISPECKARANGLTLVYDAIDQAKRPDGLTPVAFLKQDRRGVLVAMELDDYLALIRPRG